jgi:CBS domain-containing protein|tara:strand:+ start:174 stop:596 length:423 start_codon:yes stop_codon:yes gene_type:complete
VTPFIEIVVRKGCPTIDINKNFLDIAKALTKAPSGTLIVINEFKKVAGILSERDVVRHLSFEKSIKECTAQDLMTATLIYANQDVTSSGLMELMVKNNIRHVPIMDEHRLLGLVSITDVIKRLLDKQLKETEFMKEFINR